MTVPVNEILCGDYLKMAPLWPNKSVDLVLGSPPYEDARTYGMDFKLKGQDWVDWMVKVVMESLRLSRGLVAFVVAGRTRGYRWSATPALLMADLHRAGVHLRDPCIFHRVGIPGSGNKDWLRHDYEFIVCATNGGKLPWSDNTAMGHAPKWAPGGEMSHRLTDGSRVNQWGHPIESGGTGGPKDNVTFCAPRPSHVLAGRDVFGFTNGGGSGRKADGTMKKTKIIKEATPRRPNGERDHQLYEPPTLANPGNIIDATYTAYEVAKIIESYESPDITLHTVGGGLMGSDLAHENEGPFPESLAEFFVRSFCPPGGIVLDPFAGSGTTLAVAIKTGRRFIGIDIRESQCELTRRRIREAQDERQLWTA